MIEPCGWCGKNPEVEWDEYRGNRVGHSCLVVMKAGITDLIRPMAWNKEQNDILAQRRKDFEAGFKLGHKSGDNWIHFDKPETFDRYIAKERGEDGK